MAREFKKNPYLIKLMGSMEENKQQLANDLKPPEPEKPSLGNSALRQNAMSPYELPRSKLSYHSLADVINNKPFIGVYPESFGNMSDYFRNTGISPYYEIMDTADFSTGVLTISLMIDLTANNQPWMLRRSQDIAVIITVTEAYYKQLCLHIENDTSPISIRHKAYADKVSKFLDKMYIARDRLERSTGKLVARKNVVDILASISKLIEGM